jgi:hypothetical protein
MGISVCHIGYISFSHILFLPFLCTQLRIGHNYHSWAQTFVEPSLTWWRGGATLDTYLFCINKRTFFIYVCGSWDNNLSSYPQ